MWTRGFVYQTFYNTSFQRVWGLAVNVAHPDGSLRYLVAGVGIHITNSSSLADVTSSVCRPSLRGQSNTWRPNKYERHQPITPTPGQCHLNRWQNVCHLKGKLTNQGVKSKFTFHALVVFYSWQSRPSSSLAVLHQNKPRKFIFFTEMLHASLHSKCFRLSMVPSQNHLMFFSLLTDAAN